jgi:hypothetical protein
MSCRAKLAFEWVKNRQKVEEMGALYMMSCGAKLTLEWVKNRHKVEGMGISGIMVQSCIFS